MVASPAPGGAGGNDTALRKPLLGPGPALAGLLHPVLGPTQTFSPYRPIKALDKSLLVLLVGPSHTVAGAIGPYALQEYLLKLAATISLDELHVPIEAVRPGGLKELVRPAG